MSPFPNFRQAVERRSGSQGWLSTYSQSRHVDGMVRRPGETMMDASRISLLRESVERFKDAIAAFEKARVHILERRRGAADHLMVGLNERLEVNTRTLECLKRSFDLAVTDLHREQSSENPP